MNFCDWVGRLANVSRRLGRERALFSGFSNRRTMRLGILTRSLPPKICGIGDYTARLSDALMAEGHDVLRIAGQGASEDGILIIDDEWDAPALRRLLKSLDCMRLDHLVLQYTPALFSQGGWRVDQAISDFWRIVSARASTSLIVHETYFRTLRHPASLIRGTWQKSVLRKLATASDHVFSASELLVEEMSRWGQRRPAVRLPIGSAIDVFPADRAAIRRNYSLADNVIVLTLFGCGNNLRLMPRHFRILEARLQESRIAHGWLLLGGAPREVLSPGARVLSPGWLPPEALSAYLQMSDIFLMPHCCGVSAKRSTLTAAMGHGLPVIGTRGVMTDGFWNDVSGVTLFDEGAVEDFAEGVLALCRNSGQRLTMGSLNVDYFSEQLTWPTIAAKFSSIIRPQRQE
jgi:glycosyltransferase involved in cell wall biosynthesis